MARQRIIASKGGSRGPSVKVVKGGLLRFNTAAAAQYKMVVGDEYFVDYDDADKAPKIYMNKAKAGEAGTFVARKSAGSVQFSAASVMAQMNIETSAIRLCTVETAKSGELQIAIGDLPSGAAVADAAPAAK